MFLALLFVGLSALMAELVYAPDLKSGTPLGFAGSIPARRTDHRLHFWRLLWLLELCTFLCCTFSRCGGFLLLLIGGCGVGDCDVCTLRDHWCCDPWENHFDHEGDTE